MGSLCTDISYGPQHGKHATLPFQYEYKLQLDWLIFSTCGVFSYRCYEKLPQGHLACGRKAFIPTLLLRPSMSALPIIRNAMKQVLSTQLANSTLERSPAIRVLEKGGVHSLILLHFTPPRYRNFYRHIFHELLKCDELFSHKIRTIPTQILQKGVRDEFNRSGMCCGFLAVHPLRVQRLVDARNLMAV